MPQSHSLIGTRRITIVVLATIVLGGAVLRSVHLDDVTERTPDERTYIGYAIRIAQEGPVAERKMIAAFERDQHLRNYPPPIRVGHIFPLALVMRLFGAEGASAGVALSWTFSILSLVLTAWIGLRFFNATTAMAAVFLLATSSEELAMVRRAWQDATFGFFGLLLIFLAFEIMRAPDRPWLHAAFHLTGVWSVLMKQTGLIVYAVATLWLIGYLMFAAHSPRKALRLGVAGLTGVGLVAVILTALAGQAGVAWSAFLHSIEIAPEALAYANSCCEGPWWLLVGTVGLINPLALMLAIAGMMAGLDLRSGALRLVGLPTAMLLAFWVFLSFSHDLQSLRYMSPAHGAFCLLAGYGLWRILDYCSRNVEPNRQSALYAMATSALLIAAVGEYRVFEAVSIRAAMPDLGTLQIRQVLGR